MEKIVCDCESIGCAHYSAEKCRLLGHIGECIYEPGKQHYKCCKINELLGEQYRLKNLPPLERTAFGLLNGGDEDYHTYGWLDVMNKDKPKTKVAIRAKLLKEVLARLECDVLEFGILDNGGGMRCLFVGIPEFQEIPENKLRQMAIAERVKKDE